MNTIEKQVKDEVKLLVVMMAMLIDYYKHWLKERNHYLIIANPLYQRLT